jgi:O-methyltransferase
MDRALQRCHTSRIIHAFDSWEGIPKALDEDDEPQKQEYGIRKPGDPLTSSGKLVTSLDNFWANMGRWGARAHNIRAHKGWLQDTLLGWNEPIALLRIDVDLTDSVRACVRHLYPWLVRGGYCIFDDWYTSWSPQRQIMIDECGHPLESIIVPVEGNPGTVWWKKP